MRASGLGRTVAALAVLACSTCILQAARPRRDVPASAPQAAAADLTKPPARPTPATAPAVRFPHAPKGARITAEGWFGPRRAWNRSQPPAKVSRAFILPIREAITERTYDLFRRKVAACREQDAELIVLDLDTWGGQVTAALDIARTIKADLADIYTVCLIRTRAISAGAVIALACDEIAVTRLGKLGGCAPIVTGRKPDLTEREKIESVLRMELTESAEMNGYPVALAECMVTIGREAWLIRQVKTGELRYVLRKDSRGRVRVPKGVSDATGNDQADWELLRVLVPAGELLTLHPRLAMEYGFAARRVHVPAASQARWSHLGKVYHLTADPVVLDDAAWDDSVVQRESRSDPYDRVTVMTPPAQWPFSP